MFLSSFITVELQSALSLFVLRFSGIGLCVFFMIASFFFCSLVRSLRWLLFASHKSIKIASVHGLLVLCVADALL